MKVIFKKKQQKKWREEALELQAGLWPASYG